MKTRKILVAVSILLLVIVIVKHKQIESFTKETIAILGEHQRLKNSRSSYLLTQKFELPLPSQSSNHYKDDNWSISLPPDFLMIESDKSTAQFVSKGRDKAIIISYEKRSKLLLYFENLSPFEVELEIAKTVYDVKWTQLFSSPSSFFLNWTQSYFKLTVKNI